MARNIRFYEQYSMVCQVITKPSRLLIIDLIAKGKMNVSELQEKTQLSTSSLSNHLNALFKMGVLNKTKDGVYAYYSLADVSLLKIIENMSKFVLKLSENKAEFLREE